MDKEAAYQFIEENRHHMNVVELAAAIGRSYWFVYYYLKDNKISAKRLRAKKEKRVTAGYFFNVDLRENWLV